MAETNVRKHRRKVKNGETTVRQHKRSYDPAIVIPKETSSGLSSTRGRNVTNFDGPQSEVVDNDFIYDVDDYYVLAKSEGLSERDSIQYSNFMAERFTEGATESYAREWISRWKKDPNEYMDSVSKEIFKKQRDEKLEKEMKRYYPGEDTDGDGVCNKDDCHPLDPNRQDGEAKEIGKKMDAFLDTIEDEVQDMPQDEYNEFVKDFEEYAEYYRQNGGFRRANLSPIGKKMMDNKMKNEEQQKGLNSYNAINEDFNQNED